MDPEKITIGVFRRDIVLIRKEPLMFFDKQADAYYRISEKAAAMASYMTAPMSLPEFREKLFRAGIEATEKEILTLLAFLRQNHLLEPEYAHISRKRQALEEARSKSRLLRWSAAYMYFRLPPWHPEKCFDVIAPYVRFLTARWFLFLLALPALAGYLLAVREFPHVRSVFLDTLSWAGAVKYLAVIVLLKIVHEAAHSLAAMRFHCRVRGIGIGFMVFYPRLYTDTTDSWRLPRRERLLIDAAGIIAELLAGGIAAALYFYLPPGVWKSTMFYIFTVSTLSTLLVNGNPCIRYDGYYILSDLTGIDNLMTRSVEYLKQCWRYGLLKLGQKPEGKHGWFLLFFGACSSIYRIFLYTAIILIIYHKFIKVVALVLLLLEIVTLFIYPCIREIRTIRALSRGKANKAGRLLGSAALVAIVLFLFLPLPWGITLPGIVTPEKRLLVPAAEGGVLKKDLPDRAIPVKKGDILAELESAQLDQSRQKLQYLLEEDRCRYALESVDEKNFARSQVTRAKIVSDNDALAELDRRHAALTVRAPGAGIFHGFRPQEMRAGRYIPRGAVLGEIVSGDLILYAYGDDRDAAKLKSGMYAEIDLPDELTSFRAVTTRVEEIALPLKDSPLLQIFGGEIPMYQDSDEPGKFHSVRLYYRVELAFLGGERPAPGRRVICRIRHNMRLWDILRNGSLAILRREF